jgi:hypothetical protein
LTGDFWTLKEKSEKSGLRKVISWKSLSLKLQEKSRGFSGCRAGKSGISEKIGL